MPVDAVITGAIAGAIAGLVVSIISWIVGRFNARFSRRERIKHIREMIIREREHIDAARKVADSYTDDIPYVLFGEMRSELKLELNDRASEVTFDEKRQIMQVFEMDALVHGSTNRHRHNYDEVFEGLEKIEWLDLPKKQESK